MVPTLSPTLTKFLFSQNRNTLSLLTQFITGHNYLKYHRVTSGQIQGPPVCRACGDPEEVEDSWHLLAECEALATSRIGVFGAPFISAFPHPASALRFIKTTKIIEYMEPEQTT